MTNINVEWIMANFLTPKQLCGGELNEDKLFLVGLKIRDTKTLFTSVGYYKDDKWSLPLCDDIDKVEIIAWSKIPEFYGGGYCQPYLRESAPYYNYSSSICTFPGYTLSKPICQEQNRNEAKTDSNCNETFKKLLTIFWRK